MPQCKCGARIIWMKTRNAKIMPVNWSQVIEHEREFDEKRMVSHYATCPDAAKFRKPKIKSASELF